MTRSFDHGIIARDTTRSFYFPVLVGCFFVLHSVRPFQHRFKRKVATSSTPAANLRSLTSCSRAVRVAVECRLCTQPSMCRTASRALRATSTGYLRLPAPPYIFASSPLALAGLGSPAFSFRDLQCPISDLALDVWGLHRTRPVARH